MQVEPEILPLRLFLPGAFASMRSALADGFREVEPHTELWFHQHMPSGMLAERIIAGDAADIYVSANRRFMDDVCGAGRIVRSAPLAGNRLCIIRVADNAALPLTLSDLTQPDITVVTPQAQTDPCGQYIVAAFDRARISEQMQAKEQRGTLIHSIGSGDLPAFLFDGRASAGILYVSEALSLSEQVDTSALPTTCDMAGEIEFHIGVVQTIDAIHPSANHFFEFMRGASGRQILLDRGFSDPPIHMASL